MREANAAALKSMRRYVDTVGFCGNCGREPDEGSPVFCRFCGFRLTP